MPNHVHLLLSFDAERQNPTLSALVNQLKGAVSKWIGCSVWQRGFYDHIVRNDEDFRMIGEYIEHNAAKWKSDKYYTKSEDDE